MKIQDLREARRDKEIFQRFGGKVMHFAELPTVAQKAILEYTKEAFDPEAVKTQEIGFVVIPTSALIHEVMKDQDIEKDFGSFAEYHKWYMERAYPGRLANKTEVWPVILSPFNEETLQDGWHRFHTYVRNGLKKIPAVWFPPKKTGGITEQHHPLEGFETAVLKRGTTVYHGTSSDDFDERAEDLYPPAWVSDSYDVAEWFSDYQGGNKPRVITFTVTQDTELLVIRGREDMDEIIELSGGEQDPRELAEFVCYRLGYGGWTIPGNYATGADIMLCQTKMLQIQDVTALSQEADPGSDVVYPPKVQWG